MPYRKNKAQRFYDKIENINWKFHSMIPIYGAKIVNLAKLSKKKGENQVKNH